MRFTVQQPLSKKDVEMDPCCISISPFHIPCTEAIPIIACRRIIQGWSLWDHHWFLEFSQLTALLVGFSFSFLRAKDSVQASSEETTEASQHYQVIH
ncbi:hypothetical protein BC829DRAFT_143685 [Chytridium lagenaria]|nr:hypothetical protein BC829DRAFT_143685 [Chytridium lagenaria]